MEEAESGSSRPSTGLLTVPREIRNAILKMVLIARLDLWVETYWSSQGKFGCNDYETRAYFQLSLVCHQLNDEAADIFFGENRFLFPLDMTRARIPNRHAGLIRRDTFLRSTYDYEAEILVWKQSGRFQSRMTLDNDDETTELFDLLESPESSLRAGRIVDSIVTTGNQAMMTLQGGSIRVLG